jgi:hypothetical protein
LEVANQDPNQSPENVSMLTQAIRDRDEQIEQLQDKLSEASRYHTTYVLHPTYSKNIQCQKCAGIRLNGFIFRKMNQN